MTRNKDKRKFIQTAVEKMLEDKGITSNMDRIYDKNLMKELEDYNPQAIPKKTYYPDINIMTDLPRGEVTLGCFIRLKKDNIWYDVKIIQKTHHSNTAWDYRNISTLSTKFPTDFMVETLSKFHKQVYITQRLFIVNPDLRDQFDNILHPPSQCQTTEEDRIRMKYKLGL